ncbi:MAG: phosphatase PAP2 family protein [Treponema sp.]|nr:phosphatase PAP2 family protein [Treponema sp.]
MEAILEWGLGVIRAVQGGSNPPMDFFMRAVSVLGSGAAYMVLVAFVYWCVDEKKALRLGTVLLVSAWLNIVLKFLLDQPRPFLPGLDPSLGMVPASMGGLPSGHAQNSLVVWFIIASWGREKLHFVLAAVFCLLMAFSRVYLGANFPTDILGGWLVGGALLCAYFLAGKRVEVLLSKYAPRAGLVAVAGLSFAMILHRPSVEVLIPAGVLLGMGAGFHLCKRYIGFTALAPLSRIGFARYLTLFTRCAIGTAGALLVFIPSGNLIAALQNSENHQLLVFLRFALLALWVTAGAPWIFRVARLSESNVIHYQEHD